MESQENRIREEEFDKLLTQAQAIMKSNPTTGWIVVLKTAKGNVYQAVNPDLHILDFSQEDAMLQSMIENDDTEVRYIVCLQTPTCVGVTSANVRLKLRDMNEENLKAEVLWQGPEPGIYGVKTLGQLFPPSKEQVQKWIEEGKIPDPNKK